MPLCSYVDNRYPADPTTHFIFWTDDDEEIEVELGGPAVEIPEEDLRYLSQLFVFSEFQGSLPSSFRYDSNLYVGDGTELIVFFSHYTNSTVAVRMGESIQMTAGDVTAMASLGYSFETVVPPEPAAPVNTVAPAITGTPTVGQTLSCSTGTWTGYPIPTYTRVWKRDGTPIGSATASTYLLVALDEDADITCTVTATNTEGSANTTSNTVGPIAAAGGGGDLLDEIMADSPVGYWRSVSATAADGDPGAADASGNGNYLTIYSAGGGATGYPQDTASLIATEATDDAILFVPGCNLWNPEAWSDLEFTTAMSMSFWLKVNSFGTNDRDVVVKGLSYGVTVSVTGHIQGVVYRTTGPVNVLASSAVTTGVTYHVAMTYDGSLGTLILYIDGEEVNTDDDVAGNIETVSESFVMAMTADSSSALDGVLDEVAVYDHVLTPTRVAAHYAAGSGT